MKKIILFGANGFLGRSLCTYFAQQTDIELIAVSRKIIPDLPTTIRQAIWDGKSIGDWKLVLEQSEAVINLCGKSVNCRYNKANKRAILSSRLESTTAIGTAIQQCELPPKVWINAASATIYAHSENHGNTERNGKIGSGFSVDICNDWETCFNELLTPSTRKILLRTTIVLGKKGGAFIPMKRLAQFGLGGKMGNGTQQISWIHEMDFCRAIDFLIGAHKCSGIYNLGAPSPIRNKQFQDELRQQLGIPFGLQNPRWLLELGARFIRTETELILKSRFVLPERLLDAGFSFRFPNIQTCLHHLLSKHNQEDLIR
jgi:uncharacterized protein